MDSNTEIGERLKIARKAAGFTSASDAATALGVKYPTYAGHENGSRGVVRAAEKYARRFHVSLDWLLRGVGDPGDFREAGPVFVAAPLISWVSAGALRRPDMVPEVDDAPIAYAPDLDPDGDWIALRVDGDSMNRISPHDSIIFVNRKDRRLVPNACYVIGDGDGGATYKRYRPPNTWEPVSTNDKHKPFDLPVGQEPDIIGRVRKTILSM